MATTTRLIHGDAGDHAVEADLIITDPPYEMPGQRLASILDDYRSDHLVLITTMKQLMAFMQHSNWSLSFDFVLDGVSPKKSKSLQQPNYVHQTGVYLTRNKAKSLFNRKLQQRSDVFELNGYWPTIFHAPRDMSGGYAKNETAFTDLLGSFDCDTIVDPFAGTGTSGWAAIETGKSSTLIELDDKAFERLMAAFRFTGHAVDVIRGACHDQHPI